MWFQTAHPIKKENKTQAHWCTAFHAFQIMDDIYDRFHHLLDSLDLVWLDPEAFAEAVHEKGAPLTGCWGFIDGTPRPIARPVRNQRIMYSGHKRTHCLKFQVYKRCWTKESKLPWLDKISQQRSLLWRHSKQQCRGGSWVPICYKKPINLVPRAFVFFVVTHHDKEGKSPGNEVGNPANYPY